MSVVSADMLDVLRRVANGSTDTIRITTLAPNPSLCWTLPVLTVPGLCVTYFSPPAAAFASNPGWIFIPVTGRSLRDHGWKP